MHARLTVRIGCLALAAMISLTANATLISAQDDPAATPADNLRLLPGFKAELLYSVPTAEQGSWVSLTVDPQGRLLASDQYGALYRVTPAQPGDDSSQTKVEKLAADMGMAQGMLCAFDSLYVVVNGRPQRQPGLYRLRDTTGDDQYDEIKLLRPLEGGGEHGPHAVILSPDGESLFVCGGNHTKIPDPEESLVPRNWDEDQLLTRMWDAGGHAVGITAPGGWVARTDPEGQTWELVSIGFRNQYDIAFNTAGELFTYDADMEWDIGAPWYRPTRVCHVTAGSEFGWRSGTGKFPVGYPDSLPGTIDIGPGSPTGIVFGTGAKFPAKYQRALFIADWSYGIIYAVHLTPEGATYSAEAEQFCSSAALQVSDMVINPADGALYFTIGGRRTQSGLYRIRYAGDAVVEPAPAEELNALGQARRELEALIGDPSEQARVDAIAKLGHEDRFLRYAARMILEHQPVDAWADAVLSSDKDQAILAGVVAIARSGGEDYRGAALQALSKLDWNELSVAQRIELLRAYGLVLIRLGEASAEERQQIASAVGSRYPTDMAELDMELCRLLCYLEAPEVVEKTLELLAAAATQEEQIHYALCLKSVANGWSLDQRKRYFAWFNEAAALRGGHSLTGFLANIRKEAIAALEESDAKALAEIINAEPQPVDVIAELQKRPLVQQWKVDDLLTAFEENSGVRDLDRGKRVFVEAACFKCHRFDGQGGIVGPDLTAAGRRFNKQNLLEALIDPSLVVSDQYQATMFITEDGQQIVGRVVNLNGDNYMVQEDMLNPGKLTRVNRRTLEDMEPSNLSMMPSGLLDTFSKEEILDLLAYIRAGTEVDADSDALKKN